MRPSTSSRRGGVAGGQLAATAIEPRHLERNGDLGAEFLRLVERAPSQGLARDAGRKAEIVLDPGGGSGLSAVRALVEHDDREALGGGIDRGREAGRAGPDHGHVVHDLRVEVGRDAQARAGLGVGGPLQDRPVGTDHQRQFLRPDAETLRHGAAFLVSQSVQHRAGIAVAGQKTLQAHEIRRFRPAEEDGARVARLEQSNAAQDERPHDDLADLGGADHQRAHMGGIERQHGAAVRAGATRGQRSAAGELVHLAAELADAEPGDRRLMVQAVAAHDVDGTFEHQPARRVARAHLVDELAWGEFADLAAGETPRGLDLGRVQHRKHLGTAGLDKRHDGSLAGATRSQSPRGTRFERCAGLRPLLATGKSGFRPCRARH